MESSTVTTKKNDVSNEIELNDDALDRAGFWGGFGENLKEELDAMTGNGPKESTLFGDRPKKSAGKIFTSIEKLKNQTGG